MSWNNRTQSSFSEIFFPVFNWSYFLFHHSPLWASKYHISNSTRTVLVEGLLEGKAVSLWDELTEHKVVSQKASFQFLTEDISLFTVALKGFPNITLPIPQEQCYRKSSVEESCISLRYVNRTPGSFSESFFQVFNGRYFLFHHSPLWASKYPFANSTRTDLAKGFLKGKM